MKTKEELQPVVDEIREVCRKHGVVLVGTCSSEGIYGEISIGDANQGALGWTDVQNRMDNKVTKEWHGFSVMGIGDLNDSNLKK